MSLLVLLVIMGGEDTSRVVSAVVRVRCGAGSTGRLPGRGCGWRLASVVVVHECWSLS